MKYNTVILAVIATFAPAVHSLPSVASARQYRLPTCGAEICLADTSGIFDGCAPYDLVCLCSLDEDEIKRYVTAVQPCIDGPLGSNTCTDGAIYQYKDLLATVCAGEQFGGKAVEFPATD